MGSDREGFPRVASLQAIKARGWRVRAALGRLVGGTKAAHGAGRVPRAEERAARIIAEARARVDQARAELAKEIRAADRAGMRQVDIVAATGYSRERVRQIIRDAES